MAGSVVCANATIATATAIAATTSQIRVPAVSNRIILPSHSTSRSCAPTFLSISPPTFSHAPQTRTPQTTNRPQGGAASLLERHGGPSALQTRMRSAERQGKSVLFHATGERWYHATGLRGGVWHDFSLRCTTAVFVYLTYSPVVSQFENAILRPKGRMMAGTRATPPKSGGSCGPKKRCFVAHSFRPA